MEKVTAFENEQDPTRMYEALDLVEAAERDISTTDKAARNQAVLRWIRLFAALDQYLDSTWNPEKKPVNGVPPPSPHTVVYPSGEVDPETIPDPAVRAEYLRALNAGKEYMKWYDIQYQLRGIDERAMHFVERFLAEQYTDSAADQQTFENLLVASPANEVRKQRLRLLFKKVATGTATRQ